MKELKKVFYDVMYKYEKSFSEQGVIDNLNAWAEAKASLLDLLRKHPNWNENAKAVVVEFSEGRGIAKDIVDEVAFSMLAIASEAVAEDRLPAFLAAFNAAIGEYSNTLSEETLQIIRTNGQIRCASGQKTSRIIGKLCHQFGMESHPRYNNVYAQLSDALNPLQLNKTAVLSLHPCDFLEMSSRSNTWTSCHNLDDGRYQGGTLSYMIDEVSMIFFTVDPEVTGCYYRAPKRTRQMFFYEDNCLYQSRLYPDESSDISEQNRSIVHKILSTCLGVPNLWILKTRRDDINCCQSGEGSLQYPDYHSYGNLSFIKGTVSIPTMIIGKAPLCVCCGLPFDTSRSITCNCHHTVVCKECGETVSRTQSKYLDGAFYCLACVHICKACGRRIYTGGIFPAFDRKGRPVEVCADCYATSQEPCFACSVKSICSIIGNSLCAHTAVQSIPAGGEINEI